MNSLIREERRFWRNVSIEYLKMWPWSRSLIAYETLSQKPCSSFERNTHLFSETFVQFSHNKPCKIAEVGKQPDLRGR